MRKVVAAEFLSLDGVMESPDQWHFPYFNDEMGQAVGEGFETSDALLMGRVLYEEWVAFWPQQDPEENPVAATMNNVSKYVVSTTLEGPLEWNNATLIGDNVAEEISELKLMIHPIVVGGGKRLFEDGESQTALELVESRTFSTGVLYVTYKPADG